VYMIDVDSKLLEALKSSTCFGIAHDDTVPECKMCDVKAQCKQKAEGAAHIQPPKQKPKAEATPAPAKATTTTTKKTTTASPSTTKKAAPAASKPAKKPDTAKPVPAGMPDFKPMELDELKALAAQRNVEWKDYGNDNITRMRLIMVLRKSYE